MLKKTITYEDFNGEEVTEDFYFHLSKAELVELEFSHKGGLSEALKAIVASEDGKQIIAEFKKLILGAYGKRSADGKRFVKTQDIRDEFESTEAYSQLFMELVLNADKAAEFINGIVPANISEEVAKVTALAAVPESEVISESEVETFTREQVTNMSPDEYADFRYKVKSGKATLAEE